MSAVRVDFWSGTQTTGEAVYVEGKRSLLQKKKKCLYLALNCVTKTKGKREKTLSVVAKPVSH